MLRFVLALVVGSTFLVAAAPAAEAMALSCAFSPAPVGGLVGRTYDFATAVAEAGCNETASYAYDVCVAALGGSRLCTLA